MSSSFQLFHHKLLLPKLEHKKNLNKLYLKLLLIQFFLYFCVHELIINFFSKNVNRFASLFVILVRSIFGAAVFTPFFLQLTLCSSCAVRFFAAPIQSTSVTCRAADLPLCGGMKNSRFLFLHMPRQR